MVSPNRPAPRKDRVLLSAECFESAKAGDARAWRLLIEVFHPIMYRFCENRCRGQYDVDDAVQEIFTRLRGAIERVRAPELLRAFLYGIARRVLSEKRRSAWLRRWLPGVLPSECACDCPSPEEARALSERQRAVQGALSRLKPADKELLALRYAEELSFAEIAVALGITEETARKRHERALCRIARLLLGGGFTSGS